MWYSEPEQRVAEQEVADLGPAVVEDLRPPVAVLAQPGVFVLVEVGAVEEAEAVDVPGEVGGDPVEDHAEAAPGGSVSTKGLKSSGVPNRLVGAK